MAVAKFTTWSMIVMLLLFIATSIEARPLSVGSKDTKHVGKASTHKGTLEEEVEPAPTVGETSKNLDGGKGLKVAAAAATIVDGGRVSRVESVERIPHDNTGFVAFNADYHHPRHHPPKNN